MKRIRSLIQRIISRSVSPTSPAPSAFSTEARRMDEDSAREAELEMAKAKEQARRSAM